MTFSQRMGFVKVRDVIQVESLDRETRNAIWNLLLPFFKGSMHTSYSNVFQELWTELYHEPADRVPNLRRTYEMNVSDDDLYCRFIRQKVVEGAWYECLDILEYLVRAPSRKAWVNASYDDLSHRYVYHVPSAADFNYIFEQHMVGYRFVGEEITPITNETEIKAIENALNASEPAVQELLSKSLVHLSNRRMPDYAKSVDCSISAVEAQCRILLDGQAVSLGQALKELEKNGRVMHPALKGAFDKLYGFTSNADGIRHAGINPSNVDQALARFMLVTCSAFVNYLKEHAC